MSQKSQYPDGYAKFATRVMQLFGVLCGLGAIMALITLLATPGESRWLYLLVALMAGICVATFFAKPITGSDIERLTLGSMGKTHTSSIRQNANREEKGGDA
jgi:hypothetical protein